MVEAEATFLTGRQVEILELREEGLTQREIADRIETTASNVSAIERAARDNVAKARRTLELVRTIRSPGRLTVEAGTAFDDLVDRIYASGDETGVKIDYARPELYGYLYDELEPYTEENRLQAPVEIGLTNDGDIQVNPDNP